MKNEKNGLRNKSINLLLILFCIIISTLATVEVSGTQVASAYFTHIFVTDGKGKVDLINGRAAKVYSRQAPVWVNFSIFNENRTTNGLNYANFAIHVTEDGTTNSWPLEKVPKGGSKELPLSYPYGMVGPKIVNLKAELFWNQSGMYILEDVRYFSIEVVWLSIKKDSVDLSLVEICQTDDFTLTIKVQNIGNDMAYATNVIVEDAGELLVIDDASSYLGDLGADGTGTASFSFSVPSLASLGVHTITFICTYNDFSQTLRNNSIAAEIMVKHASVKQKARDVVDQVKSRIERTQGSWLLGYWSDGAQTKLDEAVIEYENAVSAYQAGNYTYAAYYANSALSLLQEANRIEMTYRMPIYLGLVWACIIVIAATYFIIKKRKRDVW